MNIKISVREKNDAQTEYLPIDEREGCSLAIAKESCRLSETEESVKFTICNLGKDIWEGIIHFELPLKEQSPMFFMPAFLYGTNRGESPLNVYNAYPRLRSGSLSKPASSWWMVRSDRLSHPSVFAYGGSKVYGLEASPYFIDCNGEKTQWKPGKEGKFVQYCGYSCSLDKKTIGYTLGYENAPWLFVDSHKVFEREPLGTNCFRLEPGESIETVLQIYIHPAQSELDMNPVLEKVYWDYHETPRSGQPEKTAVRDLAGAVSQFAWMPDEELYASFVFEKGEDYIQRQMGTFSWINGLAVAVPQLMAALRTGEEESRRQALCCIGTLLRSAMNPGSGLPYESRDEDGSWNLKGWWYDGMQTGGHSSYQSGQGMYFLLKAYDYEKRIKKVIHSEWIDFAEPILRHFESGENPEGEYPYLWSESTGLPVEYDSFGGVWCLAALAYYRVLTGADTAAELKKSERHYYDTYVRRMVCYGTPLDTSKAVDSEGILAYLRAVHWMHVLTGEEIFLDHMRDAFHYEFTFKFCYNSPVKVPPLSVLHWSSCGGSVTSVCNPHIHPMSSSVIDEFIYYLSKREDAYIRSRMEDTIKWGCQTYNTRDKEYGCGKKGWMSERFCYSEGLVVEKFPNGEPCSTWLCLMPWGGDCIIEGIAGDYWDTLD